MKTEFTAMLLVLAAMLALSSATTMNRRCPSISGLGKVPFDADKFAGEWHVVSGAYTNARAGWPPACLRVAYGVSRDANGTTTTLVDYGKVGGAETRRLGQSTGAPVTPGEDAVVAAVWKEGDDDAFGGSVSVQSVEATDYTGFAIVYSCRNVYLPESDAFDVKEYFNVWSRTPRMDAKLLEVIKVMLAGYGVDADRFRDVEHVNC